MRIISFGCGFGGWSLRGNRREFAIGPDGAVGEKLLFPDGDGFLEGVNCVAAGIESGGAMRRADRDENAGFADFKASQAVDHGYAIDGVSGVEVSGDFLHFGQRHGFVSFVFEIERGAAVRMIADATVEGGDSTVTIGADLAGDFGVRNRAARDFDAVVGMGCGHRESAAADGREEADFVAGAERSVPGGEFLVACGDKRSAELEKLWAGRGASGEEVFDYGAIAKFDGFLGGAVKLLQAAEIENFDGHLFTDHFT